MIRCRHLKMLTLEWYGNLVLVPEMKVFKYVKREMKSVYNAVFREKFVPNFIFALFALFVSGRNFKTG